MALSLLAAGLLTFTLLALGALSTLRALLTILAGLLAAVLVLGTVAVLAAALLIARSCPEAGCPSRLRGLG